MLPALCPGALQRPLEPPEPAPQGAGYVKVAEAAGTASSWSQAQLSGPKAPPVEQSPVGLHAPRRETEYIVPPSETQVDEVADCQAMGQVQPPDVLCCALMVFSICISFQLI